MKRLSNIKPGRYLLFHLGLAISSIMTFVIWSKLVPNDLILFGVVFIILGGLGGYLFWIYLLFDGFNQLDIKNNLKNDLKRFKILLLTAFAIYTLLIFNLMLYSHENNTLILLLMNILFGPILVYIIIEIVIVLTKKFKFYDKETSPNLWDYFVTMFLLSFYPFGLLIMHSHLRLIMKDHKMLEN